jgi:hypothetical protein
VDQLTGAISTSSFKRFFTSLAGEWNDEELEDVIAILLWLGLCYKGNNDKIFIPALIPRRGTPGGPWGLHAKVEQRGSQWVMGFSVRHKEGEVGLAPISLWHRFQVDLAQSLKFESELPDGDFVADKYFMTFLKDYMHVMISVDAHLDKPTFEEISIFVKPSLETDGLDDIQRKQFQVDLADDLMERLLELWTKYCPGVEYVTKVVWPWPAFGSRPENMEDRNLDVEKIKKYVQKHGMGRRTQWLVDSRDSLIWDQLLCTKDKTKYTSAQNSGFKAHAQKVFCSLETFYFLLVRNFFLQGQEA